MRILGYGEDALTLWAIKNKLDVILGTVGDLSDPSICQVFFRPSFGRSGGDTSPQFGEFDFIILSQTRLYIGESKWDRSSQRLKDGVLELRAEQKRRHEIFKFYVEQWAFGSYSSWGEFTNKAKLQLNGIERPLAPENSLLASNLQTVLGVVRKYYASLPDIRNVLLYFHDGTTAEQLPQKASEGFDLVCIDYSGDTFDNFIRIEM
jgi:hypothetical protein